MLMLMLRMLLLLLLLRSRLADLGLPWPLDATKRKAVFAQEQAEG